MVNTSKEGWARLVKRKKIKQTNKPLRRIACATEQSKTALKYLVCQRLDSKNKTLPKAYLKMVCSLVESYGGIGILLQQVDVFNS